MYRFRELLHIYTTLFIGVVLVVTYFFMPRLPLHILAAQFILIIAVAFIVGVGLKLFVDHTVPMVDPLADRGELDNLDDLGVAATDEAVLDGEAMAELSEEGAEGLGLDELNLEQPVQPGGDDYLDEDFLDDIAESYE